MTQTTQQPKPAQQADSAAPGLVTIDGGTVFPAAHVPPYRWNGFVCPAFTREQAQAVTQWANTLAERFPDSPTFTWEGDALFESCDYGDGIERTEVGSTTMDGVVLYFISDGWAWWLHEPGAGTEGE